MPFQSRSSLKTARPLKNEEMAKSAAQSQSMARSRSLLGLRRELQDGLARPDEPVLLTCQLLDVVGIVAQAVNDHREALGLQPQRRDLPLGGLDLAVHGAHAHEAAHAVHPDRRGEQHRRDGAEDAESHRPKRVYRLRPGKEAAWPSSSSMRRSWLYFAVRSLRATDPVLICPAFTATARSATKVSSVSPERCEMTVP